LWRCKGDPALSAAAAQVLGTNPTSMSHQVVIPPHIWLHSYVSTQSSTDATQMRTPKTDARKDARKNGRKNKGDIIWSDTIVQIGR